MVSKLSKRLRHILSSSCLATCLAFCACEKSGIDGFTVPPSALTPGGAFVVFVNGCEQGCNQLARGDLIRSVNGTPIASQADLAAQRFDNGKSHKLEVLRAGQIIDVDLLARPQELPPIGRIPPFWAVHAADLNRAPEWARRRFFGHASPLVDLINIDGGYITGRSMFGTAHFIVYFDWATSTQYQDAAMFLQVLMQAQPALNQAGIQVVFAQVPFPGRQRAPMGDTDLRNFHAENENKAKELPPVPIYRLATAKEKNTAREVGLEGTFSIMEHVGQSPEIVILDAGGIVRWHSAGLEPDPAAKLTDQLYTIDAAAQWALDAVGGGAPIVPSDEQIPVH